MRFEVWWYVSAHVAKCTLVEGFGMPRTNCMCINGVSGLSRNQWWWNQGHGWLWRIDLNQHVHFQLTNVLQSVAIDWLYAHQDIFTSCHNAAMSLYNSMVGFYCRQSVIHSFIQFAYRHFLCLYCPTCTLWDGKTRRMEPGVHAGNIDNSCLTDCPIHLCVCCVLCVILCCQFIESQGAQTLCLPNLATCPSALWRYSGSFNLCNLLMADTTG